MTDTDSQYENVGTDGEDHIIGNCKICGAHGVIVGEHVCGKD